MTSTQDSRPKVTYRKGDDRWNVLLDGQKVGWVTKGKHGEDAGKWTFRSPVRTPYTGEVMARNEDTRWGAVYSGLSYLSAHYGGRIETTATVHDDKYGYDRLVDVTVWIDNLDGAMKRLLDEKYPEVAAGR